MFKLFVTCASMLLCLCVYAGDTVFLFTAESRSLHATGGLGHVTIDKAKAMADAGINVKLIMPYYTKFKLDKNIQKTFQAITAPRQLYLDKQHDGHHLDIDYRMVSFKHPEDERIEVIAVEHLSAAGEPQFFENHLTPKSYTTYSHEGKSFGFYSKAAVDWMQSLSDGQRPEYVIVNDWHTGIVPVLLKEKKEEYFYFRSIGEDVSHLPKKYPQVIGAIHNLRYQGIYEHELFGWIDIKPHLFGLTEWNGRMNFLKAMIESVDFLETVSDRYLYEIMNDPAFGEGLGERIKRMHELYRAAGETNGIDNSQWDPSNPEKAYAKILKDKFSKNDLSGKARGKERLIKKFFGSGIDDDIPLVVITARLDSQKGMDFLLGEDGVFERILSQHDKKFRFIITGDPHLGPLDNRKDHPYIKALTKLEDRYPDYFKALSFKKEYEKALIYYGDFYLGASVFEPSGLPQFFSMRVGTIPILSAVGGHIDSVVDEVTGFLFSMKGDIKGNIISALNKAHHLYTNNKTLLETMRKMAMVVDNSWRQRMVQFFAKLDYLRIGGSEKLMSSQSRPSTFNRTFKGTELLEMVKEEVNRCHAYLSK